MPDLSELYRAHRDQIEDFWSRRANAPDHQRTIHILGQRVTFFSNRPDLLDSADMAARLYSATEPSDQEAWRIYLIVHDSPRPPGAPPDELADLIHYAGADAWLSVELGAWGSCFVDLGRGEAHAVLSSSIAERPELVCRLLLNTILTNMLFEHGHSMLHASALYRDGHILLLQAPHGTGKSTTALRLILNGYKLISDSMIFIGERGEDLMLGGFPAGRIKLRKDMLPLFPTLAKFAKPEHVNGELKYAVELDDIDSELSCRAMLPIRRIEFCLLERGAQEHSQLHPLSEQELWPHVMVNSMHYNRPDFWQKNLVRIEKLFQRATLHRLRIGTSADDIVKTVESLWKATD